MDRPLDHGAAWAHYHVTIDVGVINLYTKVSRAQRVISAAANIAAVPCQSGFAKFGRLFVYFHDQPLQRLLQMSGIVHLKHHLQDGVGRIGPSIAKANSPPSGAAMSLRISRPWSACCWSRFCFKSGETVSTTPSRSSTSLTGSLTTKPATSFASGEMYSSEPIGPGAANHEGMPCCASLKESEAFVCVLPSL